MADDVNGEALAAAFSEGRAAWPDVALDLPGFRAYVRPLADAAARLVAHGADLYLVAACAAADAAALRHFDGVLRHCGDALRRYSSEPSFTDDVLQRVRIHLLIAETGLPRIATYDGRASLRAWLGVCTVRMGLYVLRERRNAREIAGEWPEILAALPVGHPELESVRAQYAEVFATAWRSACEELPPRQRAVLRMCFAEGRSLDSVAAAYAVHRVTVWRWLEDAKRRLLDATRARLATLLPADAPGTQSLLALVGSQLDLGLSRLENLSVATHDPDARGAQPG